MPWQGIAAPQPPNALSTHHPPPTFGYCPLFTVFRGVSQASELAKKISKESQSLHTCRCSCCHNNTIEKLALQLPQLLLPRCIVVACELTTPWPTRLPHRFFPTIFTILASTFSWKSVAYFSQKHTFHVSQYLCRHVLSKFGQVAFPGIFPTPSPDTWPVT